MTNNRSNHPASTSLATSLSFTPASTAPSGATSMVKVGRQEMWPQSYGVRPTPGAPRVASHRPPPLQPVGGLRPARTVRPAQSAVRKLWMPLVAAVVVILAVVLVAGASRAGARSNRAVSPRTVTVVPGDTLWSIARSQKPSGDVRPPCRQDRSTQQRRRTAFARFDARSSVGFRWRHQVLCMRMKSVTTFRFRE